MPNDDQAKADSTDTTPVADPLDPANNPHGTSGLAEYEAELQSMLNAEPEDVQSEEPAAEEPDEIEAEEEVVEEEESLPEEEEEDAPEPKAKDRFRFKNPVDQAIALIAKAKDISLLDAAKIFEGQNPTERQDSEAAPEDTTEQETVSTVDQQITALRAKRAEAQKGLEFEVVPEIEAELDALIDKRTELKLKEAQDRAAAEGQQVSKFEADYAKSERMTVTYYPDSTKADSPLVKRMEEIDARMKRLGDPIYNSPDKPFQLAKIAARDLGIPMADPKAPVQKKAVARPVQPASGNARTTATSPVRTEKAIEDIGSLADYERFVGV